jgi:uncharacterized protein (DUF1499 family)
MKTFRVIGFLSSIILLGWLYKKGPLKGSENSDFSGDLQPDQNPLPPCPESPNCIRLSKALEIPATMLFDILPLTLEKMNAEQIETDSQSLQIKAVFRIPVLGFRDDVLIQIKSPDQERTVLHLSSRSRVGRGDLGVNRRRVKTFFRILNSYLN